MQFTEDNIIPMIIQACEMFMKHDSYLLTKEVNERSLTHRLAVYLESLFPQWHIDCEYNKLWDDSKRIHVPCKYEENWQTDDLNWRTVYPDIIIHRRWWFWRENNFIVIEAKKSNYKNWREKDICKLESYKKDSHYWYQYAFFIDFIIWNTPWYKLSIIENDWILKMIHNSSPRASC